MKKNLLKEELSRMKELAGLVNENLGTDLIFGVKPEISDSKVIFINPTIGNVKYSKLLYYPEEDGIVVYDIKNNPIQSIHNPKDLANANFRMNREDSQNFNNLLKRFGGSPVEFFVQ